MGMGMECSIGLLVGLVEVGDQGRERRWGQLLPASLIVEGAAPFCNGEQDLCLPFTPALQGAR
jgi:hypothetical protein